VPTDLLPASDCRAGGDSVPHPLPAILLYNGDTVPDAHRSLPPDLLTYSNVDTGRNFDTDGNGDIDFGTGALDH
jgi:hypothetical protein